MDPIRSESDAVTHDGAISVNDGCRWTIISAEATTHKFAPLLGRPKRPVAPMPVAWEAEDVGMQLNGQKAVELRGRFPKDDTSVWFGVMKAPVTKIKSSEAMSAVIPPLDQYYAAYPPEIREHPDIEKRALPINLVRDDGVVYTTEFVFEYNIKSTGSIGRVLHVDDLIYEESLY
uniref:TIG_SUH domain-containing protein n=1 Tax=Panagrellus redivivus TaxID=6233 RepID=A0A7E4V0S5_PANRE